jgi:hypothetical protein
MAKTTAYTYSIPPRTIKEKVLLTELPFHAPWNSFRALALLLARIDASFELANNVPAKKRLLPEPHGIQTLPDELSAIENCVKIETEQPKR